MARLSSPEDYDEEDFLERVFGIDRCCTIYEEDEGFKLLADLSLCTYFGCGEPGESEVPKVVSVANSEDFDGQDSISDICEERHCNTKGNADDSTSLSHRPEPPSARPEPVIISLVHPPPSPPASPPSQVGALITEPHRNLTEPSRVAIHYESREALEECDAENLPLPNGVAGRGRQSRERMHREDILPVIYRKKKTEKKLCYPETCPLDEYSADRRPVLIYSDDKSLGRERRAYV